MSEEAKKKWNWKKGLWWRVPLGITGLLLLLDSVDDAGIETATELPLCDSSKAEKLVKKTIANSPYAAAANYKILAFQIHKELLANEVWRQCAAGILTNAGPAEIIYSFTWVDKEKGTYYTQTQLR